MHQRERKSSSWHPPNDAKRSLSGKAKRPSLTARPFTVQKQPDANQLLTQEELDNAAFEHNKHEAFALQLKQEYGTLAPEEQQRLGVLQAKMDDFWAQHRARNQAQPDLMAIVLDNLQTEEIDQTAEPAEPVQRTYQPGSQAGEESIAPESIQRELEPGALQEPNLSHLSPLPLPKQGVVQRMVALANHNTVYSPELELKVPKGKTKKESEERLTASINTLTGRNDKLMLSTWSVFEGILQQHIGREAKKLLQLDNKYVEEGEAQRLASEAREKQEDRALSPDQRKGVTDQLGQDLNALTINPTWQKNLDLRQEFSNEKAVYLYPDDTVLENPHVPAAHQYKLIATEDIDPPGDLPSVGKYTEMCAIQSISDLGGDVKNMWSDQPSGTTAEAWHSACRKKKLDYRNDNEHIKILTKLGYTLVQNDPVIYNTIDWAASHLGDGKYFLATAGGGSVGHAIGVAVTGGVVTTVYDKQNIHKDDKKVKYIYKKK